MTIIKSKEDKQEFIELVSEAFQQVMIPALDNLKEEIEEKMEEIRKDLGMRIDSLDRKFDAQQDRLDKHNNRIEALEKIHPKGKHDFQTA